MNLLLPSRKQLLRQNSQSSPLNSPLIIHEEREEYLFEKEIAELLKSSGDSLDFQDIGSVHLVEKILKKELHGIFYEASRAADERRESLIPNQEDFEYVMRNHPTRVNRMRKALKNMQIMEKLMHKTAQPLTLDFRIQMCLGENSKETYDEEKTRRLFRADRISLLLTPNNFKKFNMARKNLLSRSRSQLISMNFRKFLNLPDDYDFNENLCQIVAHLANETILILIDYAILTRLNSDNRAVDPHSRTANTFNMIEMNMCPEVTQGRGLEASKPISEQEILEGYRRFRFMNERVRSQMDKGLYFLGC